MEKSMFAVAVCSVFALFAGEAPVSAPFDGAKTRSFVEFVPAPDGVKLYTVGIAPAEVGKCPIVVSRSPYVPSAHIDMDKWAKKQKRFTDRGYAHVFQHCRGCGMSEGDWIPYENERADGLALLDFVRSLPWYNGEIYLIGGSYGASVHWAYLDTDPPDVKGCALYVQDVNRYNIAYRNGFFKIALHGNWFVRGYKKNSRTLKRDRSVSFTQFPLCDFPQRYWGEDVPAMRNVLCHPRSDDPFWKSDEPGSGACFRNAMLKSSMPILLKTGFYDIYTDGVCAMWNELPESRKSNCSLIVDACDHGGGHAQNLKGTLADFPNGSRGDAGIDNVDWFDAIRGKTACTNVPFGKVRYYSLWENAWLCAPKLADGPREIRMTLGDGVHSYKYDPSEKAPDFPGSGGICFGGMQVQPPLSFRDDVLSFVLPAVTEQMDVRGCMEAELSVESDCEDTCFYIRVSVDKGDGRWLLLRDDIKSLAYDLAYVPGTRRKLCYRFADHAFRLSKGDRIRVDVASACSQFVPHPNVAGEAFRVKKPRTATNRVFAAESSLVLHILRNSGPGHRDE